MAGLAGDALGGAAELVARVRRAKPLHPLGVVVPGVLVRDGRGASGVPWLDGVGQTAVLVRVSRAGGLPPGWPDVHGVSVRIPQESAGGADLLLATTGRAPVLRHVLAPHRTVGAGTYTTLMPFRGPHGPTLLAALPEAGRRLPGHPAALAAELATEPWRLTLAWAGLAGRWRPFGSLLVGGVGTTAHDPPVRFDPTRTLLDLPAYGWLARLRDPAYVAARRGHPTIDPEPSAPGSPAPAPTRTRETR